MTGAIAPSEQETDGAQAGINKRLVKPLQGWHKADDEANRQNRNLLQYAAATATVLGIGGGSGGLFAVANSLTQTDNSNPVPGWLFVVLLVITLIIAAGLLLMVASAFIQRGEAEHRAGAFLDQLIEIEPESYGPLNS